MASGENQGMQIALIIFIVLWIIMTVLTVVFFQESRQSQQTAQNSEKKATEANTNLTKAVDELRRVKEFIGVSPDMTLDQLQQKFSDDISAFARSLPQNEQFYSNALAAIATAKRNQDRDLQSAKDEIQTLKNTNEAREGMKQPQVVQAEDAAKRSADELAADRAKFVEDITKKDSDAQAISTQLEQQRTDAAQAADTAKKDLAAVNDELKKEQNLRAIAQQMLKDQDPAVIDAFDGTVRFVDEKRGTVWIDLGSADGLQPQMLFSVYPAGQTVIREGEDPKTTQPAADKKSEGKNKRKGAIEVLRVDDLHLAEARIIDDDYTDLIVPGDRLYTPLWSPGRPERYAVAGVFDLDGDGTDDGELLRGIIRSGGGVIDAYVDATGKVQGKGITVETRFYLQGTDPNVSGKSEDAAGDREVAVAAVLAASTQLANQAEKFGLRTIRLPDFLEHAGWKLNRDTIAFGRGMGTEAISAAGEEELGKRRTSNGSVSDLFKKRRPGAVNRPKASTGGKAY